MTNTTTNPDTVRSAVPVLLRAVDKYVETNIVPATETKQRGKDIVMWGPGNKYPDYILGLYRDVATLGSIVNGSVDYVAGNAVTLVSALFPEGRCNKKGDMAVDIVRGMALDWFIYGGFALEVIRGRDGRPAEIYNLDVEDIRTNEDVSVFWWSDKWGKGGRPEKEYPSFMPDIAEKWATLTPEEQDRHAASVIYVKNTRKQVYPMPLFAQAVKACETERCIDEYHLNGINNEFAASAFIQLCNGVPADDLKAEVEKDFTEKFSGKDNAGRVILSFAPDRQHSALIQELHTEDFGARYDALAKRSRQQIFTSFRANPNLFGIPTENLGFSSEEYRSAFDLYNRTQIAPVQDRIIAAFERVCGQTGVLTIQPFALTSGGANDA